MCIIETQAWQWKSVLCESFSAVHVYVFHCHTSVSMLYMCFNAIYVFQLETHTWHWHTCMAFKHFCMLLKAHIMHWKICTASKHMYGIETLCMPLNMHLALEHIYSMKHMYVIEICAQHWNTKMVVKHMYGTYWRSVRQGWWTGPLKWQNNCVFNDKNVCHWRGGRWEFVPDFPDIKQIHRFHHFIVHNMFLNKARSIFWILTSHSQNLYLYKGSTSILPSPLKRKVKWLDVLYPTCWDCSHLSLPFCCNNCCWTRNDVILCNCCWPLSVRRSSQPCCGVCPVCYKYVSGLFIEMFEFCYIILSI